MERKKKILLALISLLLVIVIVILVVRGCSRAPEYAEIEERFRYLVESSHEINEIFFGEGLPTYERVEDPSEHLEVYRDETLEENGRPLTRQYRYIEDEVFGLIVAYKKTTETTYQYVRRVTEPEEGRKPILVNEEKGWYYYAIDYKEPVYEVYYSSKDPAEYDYIRADSKYGSIMELKNLAGRIYSQAYLTSVYGSMFDGVLSADEATVVGLSPRYMEYTNDNGESYFMKSNTYQPVAVTKNVFDYSTAKIVWPKNAKKVTVEIQFYPENNPDARDTMHISLLLENGQWMLDSPTY